MGTWQVQRNSVGRYRITDHVVVMPGERASHPFRWFGWAEEPVWPGVALSLSVSFVEHPQLGVCEAASRMGGPYRLPDALRRVDTLSRTSSITATPTTAES